MLILIELICLSINGCAPSGVASPTPERATATPTPLPTCTPTLSPPAPTSTPIPTTTPSPQPTPTEAAIGLTITIVYDNNPYDERLKTAWGFSCLVEGLERTILFDTGGDSAMLLRNMCKLGIDPQDVEAIIISHIHYDHLGGLEGILAVNKKTTVYFPCSFPAGLKEQIRANARVVEVHEPMEIAEGVYTTGEMGQGVLEQSLVVETTQELVVITGCAHPGVVNIVAKAKEITGGEVYLVMGGFHLGGVSETTIEGIVEDFRKLRVQKVAPCHCSGDLARNMFEKAYGEDFIRAGVGSRLEIDQGG
ncbi:MAG: MBL fold metallo-hydrolase [Chloroflexota bacterium]|nr:MBL fold metallo-hydrolase [Chloroflexota bacterium]